ncbi:DNA-directed RNA polymerase subunit beta [Kurthia huakuii]|uniref:DNA-directed RNA polymerase subunit beta n=1 Tax=Kurthia huakuii TaxID=1421019 RepID=UPI000497F073|nr:DNA-directed RNA polymerase subunit beta [Kurthia huakuii]MBM7698857.1 hypothetical protein [Kurthia huakuii]
MTEETKQTRMQKRQNRNVKKEQPQDVLTEQPIVTMNFTSWILRIIIVVVLFLIVAIIGAMIGYGGIGNGNPVQVLNPATWSHIFDIMNGKTE